MAGQARPTSSGTSSTTRKKRFVLKEFSSILCELEDLKVRDAELRARRKELLREQPWLSGIIGVMTGKKAVPPPPAAGGVPKKKKKEEAPLPHKSPREYLFGRRVNDIRQKCGASKPIPASLLTETVALGKEIGKEIPEDLMREVERKKLLIGPGGVLVDEMMF
jgi:hypothetical protein